MDTKKFKSILPYRAAKSISEKARTLKVASNNKQNLFSSEEIKSLKKYYPIGGLKLVKEYIPNRSDDVLYQKANQLKLKVRDDYFTPEEDKIISEIYPKNGYEKVLEKLPHRTKSSIYNRAHYLGIKYLSYNKNYFEIIDTPDKAYWLGFMYTDGYVTSNNRWGIQLSSIDREHLEKFLKCFDCNVKIKTRKTPEPFGYNNGKMYESSGFLINNSKMYNDLLDKGVVRNKTSLLKFPSEEIIPDELMKDFIRGLFDGDGSYVFKHYERKREDRRNRVQTATMKEINFVCKSSDFINDLCSYLNNKLRVDLKVYKNSGNDLNVIRMINKENIRIFIEYVYSNPNMYLERKFKKAHELLNYCLT
ncbi:LAGLIDADG family homing endonuclease [Priestia megaterium]|uniref:LAGLIDADG family homing endonuclease n=1 Tax=Priestia megaterium TaxID=1404 RepID=UPI003CC57033